MIDFAVDKERAIEALVYVASRIGQVTRFNAAKILYFADLNHLQTYGRPVTGDYYVAMENGPVPSFVYDALKGTLPHADRQVVAAAIGPVPGKQFPTVTALRHPNLSVFSKSDIASLEFAIAHVGSRSFGSISDETHQHAGWQRASQNARISFDDMLVGAAPEMIEDSAESAAYAVL